MRSAPRDRLSPIIPEEASVYGAVAHFSAWGATKEAIEQVAWEDHEGAGEEQYP